MTRYRNIRLTRIVLSIATAAALTLIWTEYGDTAAHTLGWVEKSQIVAAGTLTVASLQLLFWVIVSLIFGRIYCSGFCPLGTWMDIVSRIGTASRRRCGRTPHFAYTQPHDRLRYTILGITAICLITGLTLILRFIEPTGVWSGFSYSALHPAWGYINNIMASVPFPSDPARRVAFVAITGASASAAALSALILLAVSLPAWTGGRSFCNTVCPVGSALSLASRHSTWRIDIDTDLCTGCGLCSDACKSSCIDLNDHVVDMSRCVNCYNCLTVCPNDAIFYRPARKQLSWPMLQNVSPTLDARTDTASTIKQIKKQ